MANAAAGPGGPQGGNDDSALRAIRTARVWEVITFVAVILISPVSFVLGLPLGIAPHDWLASWTHWTVVFITVAFFVALLGFEISLSHRLKAKRISKNSD